MNACFLPGSNNSRTIKLPVILQMLGKISGKAEVFHLGVSTGTGKHHFMPPVRVQYGYILRSFGK